jgi:hypothetical protein
MNELTQTLPRQCWEVGRRVRVLGRMGSVNWMQASALFQHQWPQVGGLSTPEAWDTAGTIDRWDPWEHGIGNARDPISSNYPTSQGLQPADGGYLRIQHSPSRSQN